jgi:hypothetical protein
MNNDLVESISNLDEELKAIAVEMITDLESDKMSEDGIIDKVKSNIMKIVWSEQSEN